MRPTLRLPPPAPPQQVEASDPASPPSTSRSLPPHLPTHRPRLQIIALDKLPSPSPPLPLHLRCLRRLPHILPQAAPLPATPTRRPRAPSGDSSPSSGIATRAIRVRRPQVSRRRARRASNLSRARQRGRAQASRSVVGGPRRLKGMASPRRCLRTGMLIRRPRDQRRAPQRLASAL